MLRISGTATFDLTNQPEEKHSCPLLYVASMALRQATVFYFFFLLVFLGFFMPFAFQDEIGSILHTQAGGSWSCTQGEAYTGCNYWIGEAIAARGYADHFCHKIPVLRNLGLALHTLDARRMSIYLVGTRYQ
jgi:hypothetical protein